MAQMQRELERAVQMIGEKANAKYPSFRELRQAFRWVDESKDGKVTRKEVRNFFRVFGMPVIMADYLFSILGRDSVDEIDYSDFIDVFGPAIGIGHKEPNHQKAFAMPENRDLEREVNEILHVVAEKAGHKFRHPREALRALDLSHDGRITRDELRAFLQSFCLPCEAADHVFNLLAEDSFSDSCSYEDFMALFGPVVDPEHHTAHGTDQEWQKVALPVAIA